MIKQKNIDWLNGEILSNISVSVVKEMLKSYSKPERIRAEERTKLLRDVGKMVGRIGSYSGIFLDNEMNLLPYERIRAHLLSCSTFSKDPNEKNATIIAKYQNISVTSTQRSIGNVPFSKIVRTAAISGILDG